MGRANYGTVSVEVGSETYELKPTLKAMDKIQTRWSGGLRGAIEAAGSLGARDIAFIIAAGASLGKEDAKELPEEVFGCGTIHIAPKVIEYLTLLINPTGREPGEDVEESGE